MNRRDFLKLAGLGALAGVVPKVVIESIPDDISSSRDKPGPYLNGDVGGFLVPAEFHEMLLKKLREESPIPWPSISVKVEA